MAVLHPLHALAPNTAERVLTLAMSDWAVLNVDPSGHGLPIWKLNHVHDAVIAAQQLRAFDADKLYNCWSLTSQWCGLLLGMAHSTEHLFTPESLERVALVVAVAELPTERTVRYPYELSQCWHHPSDHDNLAIVGPIVETMLNLTDPDPIEYMQSLIIKWLAAIPFAQLYGRDGQLTTLDERRGFTLWGMAMQFESIQLSSPEQCMQYFSRGQKDPALRS